MNDIPDGISACPKCGYTILTDDDIDHDCHTRQINILGDTIIRLAECVDKLNDDLNSLRQSFIKVSTALLNYLNADIANKPKEEE